MKNTNILIIIGLVLIFEIIGRHRESRIKIDVINKLIQVHNENLYVDSLQTEAIFLLMNDAIERKKKLK